MSTPASVGCSGANREVVCGRRRPSLLGTWGGVTFQETSGDRDVTSVGWDGSRVLWSDCLQPGNTNCTIKKLEGGITRIVTSGQVGVGHLQWDATSIYWGDVNYIRKYVH